MPARGRYAGRYAEFGRKLETVPIRQAGTLDTESYLLNITNGQFGNVRVSCWPSPEAVHKGRRWGQVGSARAAIMPFRTRAGVLSSTVKLNNFELELFLCEAGEQDSGPERFPSPCQERECRLHSGIYLIDLPAPKCAVRSPVLAEPIIGAGGQPWKLSSEDIPDCDGRARAARWVWDANGHDPVLLHGGLVTRHLGEPFLVACRVRGKAHIDLPNSPIRLKFQFANETEEPKWWRVVPQESIQDLSFDMQSLEADIQILNSNPVTHILVPSAASAPRSQGHSFGSPSIGGTASVIMGDAYFGHYNRDRGPSNQ